MRKIPALIVTAMFAAVSGSALANPANKENKVSDPSAPAGKPAAATTGAMSKPGASSTMKPGVDDKKKQNARNEPRCDESLYPSKAAVPKDCFTKQGTGAAAVGSTQGQSGK